jgi:predicted PurR-regulated permease PerM
MPPRRSPPRRAHPVYKAGTTAAAMLPAPTQIDRILTLVVLGVLVAGCYLVLAPFLTAILWAAILCVTTWPLFVRLRARVGDRSGIAAFVMMVLIALLLVTPFLVVGMTIAENFDRVAAFVRGLVASGPPDPPGWLAGVPLVGTHAASYWSRFTNDTAAFVAEMSKYVDPLRKVALASGVTLVGGLLQLVLSILIAFFFYRDGDAMIVRLRAAVSRIAGERGHHLTRVAAITTRGVVLGILGTALMQGTLMAIGLAMAGIAAAPLLGFVTFLLSPVPIGPPLVWIPAGLYLWFGLDETFWGIFVLAWGALVVSSVDNFIKPLIISHGSDLPFILVLIGVLGGVAAFGVIGLFLGPVLIAVGYMLLRQWANDAQPGAPVGASAVPAERDSESQATTEAD